MNAAHPDGELFRCFCPHLDWPEATESHKRRVRFPGGELFRRFSPHLDEVNGIWQGIVRNQGPCERSGWFRNRIGRGAAEEIYSCLGTWRGARDTVGETGCSIYARIVYLYKQM